MPSPGDYLPDPSEGIGDVDDLPKPIVKTKSRIKAKCPCPHCGYNCRKHRTGHRKLRHLGNRSKERPVLIELAYSVHCCPKCKIFFNVDTTDIAAPHAHYTNAVVDLAIRVVVEDGLPYREASWHLWRDHRVFVPFATIQNWVEAAGEKKTLAHRDERFLFVRKTLTPKEHEKLREIMKGFPELRKLREIVEEVYRLFDRRCTIDTALEKLRKLRDRVKRFKELSKSLSKLESPTLEKNLVFLCDKLLPLTSNAVERGNRRHRKMQKTVYRVRTKTHIENRIALDMYRESRLPRRRRTLERLHRERCDELKRACRWNARAG